MTGSVSMGATAEAVRPDSTFLVEVEAALGGKISSCFQCNKCSSGCPVAFAMDIHPNRLLRMVQVGMKEAVLSSSTIWLCASCEACTTRCPNGVDIAALMDVLRERAVREGVAAAQRNVAIFHATFLDEVEKRGRVYETGMLARYKLRTRDSQALLADAALGWKMFSKGKLRLRPGKVRSMHEIAEIFKRSRGASRPRKES